MCYDEVFRKICLSSVFSPHALISLFFFLFSNKMSWMEEHDILFLRELLVTNPFKNKPGSRERGSSWDLIAGTLNSIEKPMFKVDQRSLRDHLNKLLKDYGRKKSYEERASGIAPEQTELDVLLEEVLSLKTDSEFLVQQATEVKVKQADEDIRSAQEIRRKSMERWSETKKRECDSSPDETPKRKRNNGSDTVNFLREKSESEIELRKSELELKREELELQRERENNANKRNEQLFIQCQQQSQALLMLMTKIADKL